MVSPEVPSVKCKSLMMTSIGYCSAQALQRLDHATVLYNRQSYAIKKPPGPSNCRNFQDQRLRILN
jgi:hypothetical protein